MKNIKQQQIEHMFLKAIEVLIMLKFQIFFNTELQLWETESAIKSRLIELLTQLKSPEFLTTFDLVFKKIESENSKYNTFYSSSKA